MTDALTMTALEALRDWRHYWPTEYSDSLTLTGKQANELCELLVDSSGSGSSRSAYVMAMAILQSDLYRNADDELRRAVDDTLDSYRLLRRQGTSDE